MAMRHEVQLNTEPRHLLSKQWSPIRCWKLSVVGDRRRSGSPFYLVASLESDTQCPSISPKDGNFRHRWDFKSSTREVFKYTAKLEPERTHGRSFSEFTKAVQKNESRLVLSEPTPIGMTIGWLEFFSIETDPRYLCPQIHSTAVIGITLRIAVARIIISHLLRRGCKLLHIVCSSAFRLLNRVLKLRSVLEYLHPLRTRVQ